MPKGQSKIFDKHVKKVLRAWASGPRTHFTGGAAMHQGGAGRLARARKRNKNRDLCRQLRQTIWALRFVFVSTLFEIDRINMKRYVGGLAISMDQPLTYPPT